MLSWTVASVVLGLALVVAASLWFRRRQRELAKQAFETATSSPLTRSARNSDFDPSTPQFGPLTKERPRVLSFLFSNEPQPPSLDDAHSNDHSRMGSFEDLVDRVLPRSSTLAHVGSSLPAETLRSAVNKLNDRLRYHIVTSKTHEGGGLSSIFAESMDRPIDQSSLPGSDAGGDDDDEDDEECDEESNDSDDSDKDNFTIGEEVKPRAVSPPRHRHLDAGMVTQVEHVLRKSELFAWLPEQILKSLVKHCTVQHLDKGQVLFAYGEAKPRASCLFVISGDLELVVPHHFFQTPGALLQAQGVDGGEEEEECAEELEETLTIGQGRMLNGISDFVATIVGQPAAYVGTGRALSSTCVVAEITHTQLAKFFDSYEGVREELLLRALTLLQRVVFTSIYRLTGRYASSFTTQPRKPSPKPTAVDGEPGEASKTWAEIAGKTLGISAAELVAFSKEKRRKTTAAFVGQLPLQQQQQQDECLPASAPLLPPVASEFPLVLSFTHKQEVINHSEGWNPALYIVLSGALEVRTLNFAGDKVGTLQYRAVCGDDVGQLAVITKSFAQWYSPDASSTIEYPRNVVVSIGNSTALKLCEQDYFELLERFPDILSLKAREVCGYLSPIVHLADCATYFKQVQPNQTVVADGQLVDGMMVVLHGRIKFFPSAKVDEGASREYGRGAVLGETSYLTNQPFFGTLQAMRKTNLAYIPKLIVRSVTANYPDSLVHIGRQISNKMFLAQHDLEGNRGKRSRTVAVLPVSPNVPLESFTRTLKAALVAQGRKCAILTGALQLHPKQTTFDEMEILSRMQDMEESHDVIFYQLDAWTVSDELSKWSKLCIAQADTVLVVVNAGDKPMPCAMEKRSRQVVSSAKRELVVLHVLSDTAKVSFLPQKTREWVNELGQTIVHSHHIRYHPYDVKVDTLHWKSDLRRLARWISGNAIGLVLGGGGARGSAHLSVLKALEHCEVPIDFVGGTSIGAFVGGIYCMTGGDFAQLEKLFTCFAADMSSTFNTYRDFTFPIVSYLTGYSFNRAIVKVFGDVNIEDFWINFYCVTTDLSASRELAHRNGFAWKYIRASMTLTGYLPPICDVQGEGVCHYLIDGGYIDNLPVDAMRKSVGRSGTVIAVDVQSAWKLGGLNFGHELNGWLFLWQWLSPFSKTPDIPTASEIQSHLAYVSCVQRFSQSSQKWNLYIAPPLPDGVTTMGFSNAKTIQEKAYPAVLNAIEAWLGGEEGARVKGFVGDTPRVAVAVAVEDDGLLK